MNSSKSGARSMELLPEKFYGRHTLLRWTRQPISQGRPRAAVVLEGCGADDSFQRELHG